VKKPVSKFAFQKGPAALHHGLTREDLASMKAGWRTDGILVGLCTLNQVDP
jgi:hypothetical protein